MRRDGEGMVYRDLKLTRFAAASKVSEDLILVARSSSIEWDTD